LRYDLDVGDILIFNSHILHGSGFNDNLKQRRAVTFRYLGENVVYKTKPGCMETGLTLYDPELKDNQTVSGWLYPVVLPVRSKNEIVSVPVYPHVTRILHVAFGLVSATIRECFRS